MTKPSHPCKRHAATVIPDCLRDYYANSASSSVLEDYRTGNYQLIVLDPQGNRLYDGPGKPRGESA